LLKSCGSGRDPALRGFCKCSHISAYAALSKTPRAWVDSPMLVFKQPDKGRLGSGSELPQSTTTGPMGCIRMNAEKRELPGGCAQYSEEPTVEQELVILPDGGVEISWVSPEATRLVLAVWQAVSDEPFPVRVLSGNLYCG
jgi:hypothetical protein